MLHHIYGHNPVRECLRARRRHINKIILTKNVKKTKIIREIVGLAKDLKVLIKYTERNKLDSVEKGHQNVILEVGNLPTVEMCDILDHARKLNQLPFVLALDHLEDPQNVGALLRTAESVGVHGVIIPKKRAVRITASVVSASAGATEHLNVAYVPNLSRALHELKKENVWVVGVEKHDTAQLYHKVDLDRALVLVLGHEGKGLSRLVRETCDFLIEFPMQGKIESLNVSVAGALSLYEAWRSRKFLKPNLTKF